MMIRVILLVLFFGTFPAVLPATETDYLELRSRAARQVLAEYAALVEKEWGQSEEPFRQWIEARPELLEEYLTALEPDRDDFAASLALMRRLCTDHPEAVDIYPELAIAMAVVWDQPDSPGFAGDSRSQFQAFPPPGMATAMDVFRFYTAKDHPAAEHLKKLHWEFLVYVVSNKRSADERNWVMEHYKLEPTTPGKAYMDVPYNMAELKGGQPALTGKPYTFANIRKYGGVCTAQADFALPVSRTLGIPAFYGGAGFPRYIGGHSWIMWLDIRNIEEGKVVCEFREEGRGDRHYVAGYSSPQTGLLETDENLKWRFRRAGENIRGFRQSKLMMRHYSMSAKEKARELYEEIDFLLSVQKLCPGRLDVWQSVAELGRSRRFRAADRERLQDLARLMREDLADFPNELPGLTMTLLSFPEIETDFWTGDRWRVFEPLLNMLEAHRRPDLHITAAINFNRLRLEPLRAKMSQRGPSDLWFRHQTEREDRQMMVGAVVMLQHLACLYAGETSLLDRVFDEMESITGIPGMAAEGGLDQFYSDYAKTVENELSGHLPKDYRQDLYRRFQRYFEKYGAPDRADEMRKLIEGMKD